jgi:hypothetical protein
MLWVVERIRKITCGKQKKGCGNLQACGKKETVQQFSQHDS